MPYTIETQPKDGYLLFVVSGVVSTIEDIALMSQDIMAHISESGCSRLIIDERAIVREVDPQDFTLFVDHSLTHVTMWLKTGAVYTPEDAKTFSWVETALQGRSIPYKIFDNMDDATDWVMC